MRSRSADGGLATQYEIYDYPGTYHQRDVGERYVRRRREEREARREHTRAESTAAGLGVGHIFSLEDHPRGDQNREFLIVAAQHQLRAPDVETAKATAEERWYSATLTVLDSQVPYRSPRTTPVPRIEGPQTAIVVGPKEKGKEPEKIWTDEYGRVKVQFHWDRYGKHDHHSSCWIRVSQGWAGHGWGGMHIPHVGQEVIVEFLEGDPDQPVITGRVYNAANMPPLKLPENKHKSILSDDFGNQITFDATPGDEHITLNSPHHGSGLVLGKSANLGTFSDEDEMVLGVKNELVAGVRNETMLGRTSELTAGSATNLRFGGLFEGAYGWSASVTRDHRVEYNMRDDISVCADDHLRQARDQALFDSHGRIQMVTGKNQESVIRMREDALDLLYGHSDRASDVYGDLKKYGGWLTAAGIAMGVTNLIAAGAFVANAAIPPPAPPSGSDDADQPTTDSNTGNAWADDDEPQTESPTESPGESQPQQTGGGPDYATWVEGGVGGVMGIIDAAMMVAIGIANVVFRSKFDVDKLTKTVDEGDKQYETRLTLSEEGVNICHGTADDGSLLRIHKANSGIDGREADHAGQQGQAVRPTVEVRHQPRRQEHPAAQ